MPEPAEDSYLTCVTSVSIARLTRPALGESRSQEGCRFCREQETEEECVERCSKGCRICAGKDGDGLDSCKNRKKEENQA